MENRYSRWDGIVGGWVSPPDIGGGAGYQHLWWLAREWLGISPLDIGGGAGYQHLPVVAGYQH